MCDHRAREHSRPTPLRVFRRQPACPSRSRAALCLCGSGGGAAKRAALADYVLVIDRGVSRSIAEIHPASLGRGCGAKGERVCVCVCVSVMIEGAHQFPNVARR